MLKFRRILNSVILLLLSSVTSGLYSAHADGFSMGLNLKTDTAPVEPWYVLALPEYARRLVGQKSMKHSPNCFNSALVGSGVLDSIRHTSSDEMLAILKSPICEKIHSGQQKSGDIQVFIRQLEGLNESNSLAHANNWLSDGFAFNKMSLYSGSGYEIIPHQFVLEKYQYIFEAQVFNQIQPDGTNLQIRCDHGVPCKNKIEFYRCGRSVNDYILKNIQNKNLLDIYYKIKTIEKSVERIVFSKYKMPSGSIEETRIIKTDLLKIKFVSKNDLIVADYLEHALDSILRQFDY